MHICQVQISAGDERCDSPGFSAKYCTYSLLDTATNLIVHMETLKRSDVCIAIWFYFFLIRKHHLLNQVAYKSLNMETEAPHKALCFLEEKVSISEVVTDASRTVTALLGKVTHL